VTRSLSVGQFLERSGDSLQLEDLGEGRGLDRTIPGAEISSPGLALAGYVDRFVGERLQVLGETEVTYLASIDGAQRDRILTAFFNFPLPAIIVTKGRTCHPALLRGRLGPASRCCGQSSKPPSSIVA
jgi:HPr kinase/phosphorylase